MKRGIAKQNVSAFIETMRLGWVSVCAAPEQPAKLENRVRLPACGKMSMQ
jgi:hypothetical protein